MADETYRPQKRNISAEDINAPDAITGRTPHDTKSALDQMAAMRAEAGREVNKEVNMPQVEGGMQVSGNMPEVFKKMVVQQRDTEDQPLERRGPKKRQEYYNPAVANAEMRVVGSTKLDALIGGIAEKSGMSFYSIQLPSKGKFYNGEDGPEDGMIYIRPMTGEEEEILATPHFVKRGQAINMIFDRCMRGGYKSANFLTQDRTYMLIYLRGISYTEDYEVEVRDPESDQTFATTIDLTQIYVDYCPDDFGTENLNDTLPTTGYRFSYRLANGKDEQAVNDYRQHRGKNFDLTNQADDTLLWRTAYLLNDIEGLTDKMELQILLKRLPISDVAYLRTVVNEPPFGVDTKIDITNPYTLSEFQIDLPLEANFFFPRAKRKKGNIA